MKVKTQYIEVAPAVPLPGISSQTFTYEAPIDVIAGQIVQVPFGPRPVHAVVVAAKQPKPGYKTKAIMASEGTQVLSPTQLQFAAWIAATMHGSLGYTMRLFFPPAGTRTVPTMTRPSAQLKKTKIPKDILRIMSQLEGKPGIYIEGNQANRHATLARLASSYAQTGQQVLLLVPEISLVGILQKKLLEAVGMDEVAPYFAGQHLGIRREIWQAVAGGEPVIVIGTHKALFLPWQRLGLVVIEQAHYPTHKAWEQYPRLDNTYAAKALAQIAQSAFVTSAAFSSLAIKHQLNKEAPYTIANNPLTLHPTVTSMSFEDKKNRRLLPQETLLALKMDVKKGRRVFCLLNRRGTWQRFACKKCHRHLTCPDCGSPVTVVLAHKKKQPGFILMCQGCHKKITPPALCPACKKGTLAPSRAGSQQVANMLQQFTKASGPARLDADSLAGLSRQEVRKKIQTHPFIIGTNAALTHLEGEELDKVYWFFPEDSLWYPDIRSSERCLILLSRLQALVPGSSVHLVTRQPQLLRDTIAAPLPDFYKKELRLRQTLWYPPFADIVRLTLSANKDTGARRLKQSLVKKGGMSVKVRGPYQSLSLKKKVPQTHILLAGELKKLVPLYRDLSLASVDLNPEKIL
ncbi:MAG: hypothetical protein HYZ62_01750 [Candidatus Andersenbacteria bacterium]|nr:hypothetical protein [Candidatus Andersenbacteria bacterium]